MSKVYISEHAHDAVVTASERLLAWQNWGVDNRLTLEIARECEAQKLPHSRMSERLCGELRAVITAAKLEAAGERARQSAAQAIVASEEAEAG